MDKCLMCVRFPFCGNEKETCIDFKKRGIEYEKLKKKTEQKEKEIPREDLFLKKTSTT